MTRKGNKSSRASMRQYLPLFKALSKLKPAQGGEIYGNLSDDAVNAVCECVHNIAYSDIGLSRSKQRTVRKCMCKNKSAIKFLAKKNNSITRKRKLMKQEGGYLGTILAAAVPFLISLFTRK